MSAPLKPRTAAKLHPDDQRCNNCANARPRPTSARMAGARADLECRWEGPPWEDKGVLPGDWCRRWSERLAPKGASARPAPKAIEKDLNL